MTDPYEQRHDDEDVIAATDTENVAPIRSPSFIAEIHRNTLRWVASHPHDYASLVAGPLGQALTRAELRDLAGDEQSMERFTEGVRQSLSQAAAIAPNLDPDS